MANIRAIIEDTLIICGFVFIQVIIHEIVHMIDGWNSNVAVCFGFLNLDRVGFVINGMDYTLYNGELLAYSINVLVAIVLFYFLWRKKDG